MTVKNVASYLAPTLALAGIALMGTAPSWAAPQTQPVHPGSINSRLHEQHKRIEQGVHSGSLTRRERERVAARDARVRYQESRMRIYHKGHLTTSEHARLERELNRNSKAIHHQKHDAQHR